MADAGRIDRREPALLLAFFVPDVMGGKCQLARKAGGAARRLRRADGAAVLGKRPNSAFGSFLELSLMLKLLCFPAHGVLPCEE